MFFLLSPFHPFHLWSVAEFFSTAFFVFKQGILNANPRMYFFSVL